MIYIIWDNIKDGFADFLFSFRELFCKSVSVNNRGLEFCLMEESKIYDKHGICIGRKDCCKENCPKRERITE